MTVRFGVHSSIAMIDMQHVGSTAEARRWRATLLVLTLAAGTFGLSLVLYAWHTRDRQENRNLSGPAHELLNGSGLYFLGADPTYSNSGSYAVKTNQGIVVIDPGFRFAMLQGAFQFLGLDIAQVKIVLVTHRHADHWFAARELVARSGATVMVHEGDAGALTEAADLGQYYACYPAPITDIPTLASVRPLKDGEIIRLGDCAIEVIATPGHTPGSACYRTQIQKKHVLWCGDTVVALNPESFWRDWMTRMGPEFGGDITSYVSSLRRLNSIPVDILLPGHPAYNATPDCFLGPKDWNALLEPNIKKLESWLRDYPTEVTMFLDGTPKALTEEIVYLGESQGTAAYVFKTAEGAILIDPGQRSVAEIRQLLSRFGADPLLLVLVTSTQRDHCAAAAQLCQSTGAKLYSGIITEALSSNEDDGILHPDRILVNGEEFQIGGLSITAIDSGAGNMSYLTRISDRVVLVGGDNLSRFALSSDEEHHKYGRRPEMDRKVAFYQFLKRQSVQIVLPAHPQYHESPFYLPGEWQMRTKRF